MDDKSNIIFMSALGAAFLGSAIGVSIARWFEVGYDLEFIYGILSAIVGIAATLGIFYRYRLFD